MSSKFAVRFYGVLAALLLTSPAIALAGAQTFSTPGLYTFTVPNYIGTLKVEVWGGGGGGSSGNGVGNNGGASSGGDGVVANGGSAGYNGGAGGTASGGSTNMSGESGSQGTAGSAPFGGTGGSCNSSGFMPGGGGGPGTMGGRGCYGGGGGGGAYAAKTYTSESLRIGATIPIVIGAGGKGGPANVFGFGAAGDGAPGSVKITWTSPDQTLSLCSPGYTLDNGKCVLNVICSPGYRFDVTTGACVPDTTCSVGFHLDTAQNKCVLNNPNTCPAGTRLDPVTNTCISAQCPAGQTWNGTACVCPAGTIWYQNQCRANLCTPRAECDADGNVRRTDIECEVTTEPCRWGCTNGACNPPPQPQIITWKVSPKLVQKNGTAGVFWNVMNVQSCVVTSTNGDSWTSVQGGVSQGSKTARPITARTTFTLDCTPYEGAQWTPQEPKVVNIVPVFHEQ